MSKLHIFFTFSSPANTVKLTVVRKMKSW